MPKSEYWSALLWLGDTLRKSILILGLLVLFGNAEAQTTVKFRNGSSHSFNGWIHATIPFEPDTVLGEAELQRLTLSGVPTDLKPLKWHWRNGVRTSIALAKARAFLSLSPGEVVVKSLVPGSAVTNSFAFGAKVAEWLSSGKAADAFSVLVRLQGDPSFYVASLGQNIRVLESTNSLNVIRNRVNFVKVGDPSTVHPLTLTLYWSVQSNVNLGKATLVLGNDTLEQPVQGGIVVEEAYLVAVKPLFVQPVDPTTSGIVGPLGNGQFQVWKILQSQTLSDGQEFALDFAFAVSDSGQDLAVSSMKAMAEFPLYGVADVESWRRSEAAGPVGFIPPSRFTSLAQGTGAVEELCTPVMAGAQDSLGTVNANPPSTGDQPDFGSNIPLFYLQVVQTGSICPLRKHLIGSKRETWRPSYYWDTTRGYPERVSAMTYPTLFLWSGRPHFDPSWNREYPIWNLRTGSFNPGFSGPWGGMDNQHSGHNGLRAVYELTADPYIEEVLKANISLLYFNFYTKWFNTLEAERTGRSVKEAVMLSTLFPNMPEALLLREKVLSKNQLYLSAAQSYINLYGIPAISGVANDPRVTLTQQFPNQEVHMAWQTGFNLEGMSLSYKMFGDAASRQVLDLYLDAADRMFLQDGTPKTYYLMSNSDFYTLGGIGVTWWSGWMFANRVRPGRANSLFLSGPVADNIRDGLGIPPGQFWSEGDRWRCFE